MRYIDFKGKRLLGSLIVLFRRVLRDQNAQALTEYAVLMMIIMTLCFYLYHPDNLIYHAFRARYDMTVLMLSLPGP